MSADLEGQARGFLAEAKAQGWPGDVDAAVAALRATYQG
jgi:hypothetical protein